MTRHLQILLWLCLTLRTLGQATPASYPYPDPLPTSGDISPSISIQTTLPIATTSYADHRPAIWDDFIGGGYRSVLNTTERDQINAHRRKEGMLVWVASDNHTYRLASDLTTWTDLGILAAGGSATTIYTGNGTLSGHRTINGGGFNFDMVSIANVGITAGTSITYAAPTITLNGGSYTRINNSGPSPFIFAAAPSVSTATHQLLARNPSTGEVTFTPNATIGQVPGTTIYKGVVTGTPGSWVVATADLSPSYSSGSQPPEGAVAILKFPSNSVGSDTLQFGDNTTGIPITGSSGTAVAEDEIVSGQYLLFIRSGTTSGSHWTFQPNVNDGALASPSTGVVTVETADVDLEDETADIVITQGYYSVGDGGHAAYRADAASADTINNVTVWARSAGGRYILMVSGAISAKQAGVVGDGTTDDHDALQTLFDLSPNLTVRLEPLQYRSVGGLTLPDHVKVIARGADLTCETTGEDRAIDMGSWCSWIGGTVRAARQSGGSSGQDHCSFRIGDWKGVINHGVSNIVIRDVIMTSSGNFGSAGAFITQNSHNVEIDNFEIPASATQGNGITVHWGFVTFAVEADGTRHPHNIRVRNGNIGAMTTTTFEGNAVACSAGYDISFENIRIDRCRYPIESTVGDFGFQYSGLTQLDLGSVSFKNITCLYVYNYGAYIRSEQTFDTDKHNLNHVIENCTLIGANAGAGQGGLWIDSARNVMIRDTVIAGHEVGTIFVNGCANVIFDHVLFATNRLGGFVADDANTKNVTVRSCQFQNNGWGLSGNNAAGIIMTAGNNFRIIDNDIGNPVSEPNQEVGIKIVPTFVNATVTGNKVLGVKGGGVNIGYYFGSASDTGHLYLVQGNSAASGITLISGPDQIPFLTRGTLRDFTGTGTPTVGTYLQGDRVILNTATSTPFAKVCTVAGSPGTWVTLY